MKDDLFSRRGERRVAGRPRGLGQGEDHQCRFDAVGLWSCRSVWFSKHATLLRTCAVLVTDSEAGYATDELEHVLHVGVKDPLRKLAGEARIFREKVSGRFVHFASDGALGSLPRRDTPRGARRAQGGDHPLLLAAGRAAAPAVCGSGVAQSGARRRPPDGRPPRSRRRDGGKGAPATPGEGRGSRPGAPDGRGADAAGKKRRT